MEKMEGIRMDVGELVKLVGSNLVTLLVAYMVFASTGSTNDNALLATVLERQKVLEESNASLMARVMALGVENIELKALLRENITRNDLYQTFLDGLPFPAWIKKMGDDGEFRMVMINNAYSQKFNVSKARYQGATDAEVWGERIAKGFKISDEEVFESKGFVLTREYFPEAGRGSKPAWHSVWKFSLRLGEGLYGVGGVVVVDFIAGDVAREAEQRSKMRIYEGGE
jgi:hypothetical protein